MVLVNQKQDNRTHCDLCNEHILRGTKADHFRQYHPKLKFTMVKRSSQPGSTLHCGTCNARLDSFADLVRLHKHDTKSRISLVSEEPIIITKPPKSQPLDVLDGFFGNFDLLTIRLERLNTLEKKVGEYAAKIVELQEIIARRE